MCNKFKSKEDKSVKCNLWKLHQGNHLCLGIRQSICYLPEAHTFRVPAVFDYIGMLQSLPKLICQFHFLVPVLFFYLWEVLYQSNTCVLFTSGTRHNKSLKDQMKIPKLDFHELCRTTSLLVPTIKDLKYKWQRVRNSPLPQRTIIFY